MTRYTSVLNKVATDVTNKGDSHLIKHISVPNKAVTDVPN